MTNSESLVSFEEFVNKMFENVIEVSQDIHKSVLKFHNPGWLRKDLICKTLGNHVKVDWEHSTIESDASSEVLVFHFFSSVADCMTKDKRHDWDFMYYAAVAYMARIGDLFDQDGIERANKIITGKLDGLDDLVTRIKMYANKSMATLYHYGEAGDKILLHGKPCKDYLGTEGINKTHKYIFVDEVGMGIFVYNNRLRIGDGTETDDFEERMMEILEPLEDSSNQIKSFGDLKNGDKVYYFDNNTGKSYVGSVDHITFFSEKENVILSVLPDEEDKSRQRFTVCSYSDYVSDEDNTLFVSCELINADEVYSKQKSFVVVYYDPTAVKQDFIRSKPFKSLESAQKYVSDVIKPSGFKPIAVEEVSTVYSYLKEDF